MRRLVSPLFALIALCALGVATSAPAQDATGELEGKLDELEANVDQQGGLQATIDRQNAEIDQLIGQEAALRFSAFDQRTTPEVSGHVISVSADAYLDERLGHHYYDAVVELDEGQAERLDHVTLLPGMPVEAFIRTADRSALSYLVKPMSDYFTRAFRES